jgi:hypothetical protein
MGHAAETIVAGQLDDLQPPLSEIRGVLSDDLLWRTGWAQAMVRHLIDDGLELERIIWAADWGEKWNATSGDEKVVRLDTEIAQLEAHVARATDINATSAPAARSHRCAGRHPNGRALRRRTTGQPLLAPGDCLAAEAILG